MQQQNTIKKMTSYPSVNLKFKALKQDNQLSRLNPDK